MAKTRESDTPKAKETKSVNAGIAKSTPAKTLPLTRSPTKSVAVSEDLAFMWKLMQISSMKVSFFQIS